MSAASLKDLEESDLILILGEDLSNTAPRMALAVRQSKGALFVLTPYETRLDEAATQVYYGAPDDIARRGFALANRLDPSSPAPKDLSEDERRWLEIVHGKINAAKKISVITGTSLASMHCLKASANIAFALQQRGQDVRLSFLPGRPIPGVWPFSKGGISIF